MAISDGLMSELQHEAATTRKILERVPETVWSYKPHEKSMAMGVLATHVAGMHGWIKETLEKPEIDLAADNKPFKPATTAELLEDFDRKVAEALESLKGVSDEQMFQPWQLKNGEQILLKMVKIQALRGMVMNHILHHRGQLSVYLRLNNIPVPSIYGPSADEAVF